MLEDSPATSGGVDLPEEAVADKVARQLYGPRTERRPEAPARRSFAPALNPANDFPPAFIAGTLAERIAQLIGEMVGEGHGRTSRGWFRRGVPYRSRSGRAAGPRRPGPSGRDGDAVHLTHGAASVPSARGASWHSGCVVAGLPVWHGGHVQE